jgi:hypothetical protein
MYRYWILDKDLVQIVGFETFFGAKKVLRVTKISMDISEIPDFQEPNEHH